MDDSHRPDARRSRIRATALPPNCAATSTASPRHAGCCPRRRGAHGLDRLGRTRRPAARRAGQPGLAAHRRPDRRGRRAACRPASVGVGGPARGVALHGDRRRDRSRSSSATPGPTTACTTCRRSAPGTVGAYLGIPLTGHARPGDRRALRVRPGAARPGPTTTSTTLRQLAESAVTELELVRTGPASTRADRVRWGLAIDAAGIGTFDWDLTTGRLTWDDRLIAMFGYEAATFDAEHRGVQRPPAPRRPAPGDRGPAALASTRAASTTPSTASSGRTARPAGCTPAAARSPAPTGRRSGSSAPPTTPPASARARRTVTRVLEAMPAGFYSLDREWRFTHVNAEAERLLGRTPRGAAREGAVGRLARGDQQHLRGELPHRRRAPACPSPSTPTTPRPLDGWYELRAWPTPRRAVGLLPGGDRAPAGAGAGRAVGPAAGRSWPR